MQTVSRYTDNVERYRDEARRLIARARSMKARGLPAARFTFMVRLAREDFRHYLRHR